MLSGPRDKVASEVNGTHFSRQRLSSLYLSRPQQRLHGPGSDAKSWYHDMFLRSRPALYQFMIHRIDSIRHVPNPFCEPNLCVVEEMYPRPPQELVQLKWGVDGQCCVTTEATKDA